MAIPVAALAAGASALSSAMSAGGGLLTNARTLQHDDYWRNQSRKWQLADEARQNAYNAPRAQMARLRAGGLSASMAAQSIAGTGSTSAGPGTYSGPTGGPNLENPIPEKFFDAQSAITLAETIKNNERNRALTNANIANIDADTVNKGVQTSLLNLDNELRRLDLQYRKEDRPRSVQAQINNLEKDKLALLNMQADYAKTQAMIEDFKSQAAFRKGSLSVSRYEADTRRNTYSFQAGPFSTSGYYKSGNPYENANDEKEQPGRRGDQEHWESKQSLRDSLDSLPFWLDPRPYRLPWQRRKK